MQLWFPYASCGILLILNQGYTDQTCVMSKVFVVLVEIFRTTLRRIKRQGKVKSLGMIVLKYGRQVEFKDKEGDLFCSGFLV